jgi:hypothetical protein
MDNNISFSKIVATPTLSSWSQAYNAGKLFAVLSLEKIKDIPEIESLNMFGKDLLERLEQEFFAIENKDLESIKKAISAIFANPIEGVNISFAAGVLVKDILYLFGLGNSKVFIKRSGSLGLALDTQDTTSANITSSSGFLKEGDLIVLTTDAFSQIITQDDLDLNLNDAEPSEITESLAPKIHKSENGKISAIIIKYKSPQMPETPIETDEIEQTPLPQEPEAQTENVDQQEKSDNLFAKFILQIKSKIGKPNFRLKLTKKLFLALAIAIVGILIFSIVLGIREQNNAKIRALFTQIYPQAQKKYEDGQSLLDLNKNLARDSLQAAEKILKDNLAQFPAKSKENLQVQDLLKKIDSGLAQVSPIDKSGLDRSKLSVIVANGSGVEGTAGKGATILKDFGYNVVSTENADNFNYQGVTIKVKDAQSNFANLLKQDLSREYTIKASSSDLAADYPTDALIIIGK